MTIALNRVICATLSKHVFSLHKEVSIHNTYRAIATFKLARSTTNHGFDKYIDQRVASRSISMMFVTIGSHVSLFVYKQLGKICNSRLQTQHPFAFSLCHIDT